jgi:thioredoxin 1
MILARLLTATAMFAAATFAHALEIKPYTADALAAAEQAGKPVAVHFHADWCPTCRAQDKSLQTLKDEKALDVTILTANYDTEKDLKRRFNVKMQSTLVVLKGNRETARLSGDSTADGLRKALQSAL